MSLQQDIYAAGSETPSYAITKRNYDFHGHHVFFIAQPGMNMGQDRQMQMVGGNVVQNPGVQNVRNHNGLLVVPGIANQNPNGNGNVVAARAEGNAIGNNVRPRRRDAAYIQTQLLIAQKEEAGIQIQAEEFDLMAAAADLDEIEEVNANYGSAEVHNYDNCYDNEIFNMFTQEEQYTELLKPIPEPHQVQQNDSNVISEVSSMEQDGGTVDQHPATVEETRAYFESLYNNLAIEVEKVNSVNRKMKETNADLTTELARYKNQEKCFEISQEKYDKLERCYQKSVYQEQCLTKKINALHLSSGKQITTLNEEISNLNKQLSKEKSTVSSLLEEKKKLKSDFKIREDELLDKQIQLENKIKELDNILVKTGQSIQTMHMLSPKPDSFYHTEQKMALGYQNPFYLKQAQQKQQSLYNGKVLLEKHDPPVVYDSEETLELAQESRLKMKQLNKEIQPANYTNINHLSGVFVSQMAKSREELYFSNTSKIANVSKSISIPNEKFSNDTTPSVARKFLHEALELEIERLLRAVVSKDIMSIVQRISVVDTSNLQTELDRTKESFENYIIKKENEYAKVWNYWYKKCEECKYDKISQATPAWTNANRVNKANQFTPRPVQLSNIRPNHSTVSRTVKTGRVNVNTGHGNVNSGSMHVNSGTQIKSGASRFNTGKQHVSSGGVNRPVSNNTGPKPSQVNLNSPKKCFSKQRSLENRPFSRNTVHKSNIYVVKGKMGTAVKTSAGCVWRKITPLSNTNSGPTPDSNVNITRAGSINEAYGSHEVFLIVDVLGHMTGNRGAHLEIIKELSKEGYVTFGGSKGSISGKENKHPYLAVSLTKKIFGNMKRGFQGAPRPLLPSMLLVATNPIAGQEHAAQAQSQSQPSPTPPPIPTSTSPPPPIPTSTPPPIPTSTSPPPP
ncbi:hypothetical protein Tco_0871605, partial [Tanacetum coccineum]